MNAYNLGSEVEARDVGAGYIPREKEATLAGQAATTAHTQALTDQIKKLGPGELAKLLAGNKLLGVETSIKQQELEDQKALGGLPKQIMQEKLNQARREGSTYVDFELPSGKKIVTTTDKIMDMIKLKEGGARGQLTEQNKITNARNTRIDIEKRLSESEDAEGILLGTKKAKDGGTLNTLDPAAKPYADEFNRKSDKPYTYVWGENAEKNLVWPNKPGLHKVDLPVAQINGKPTQLTARMLTEIGKTSKPPLEPKQVLEVLQRSGVIKGKLPWQ